MPVLRRSSPDRSGGPTPFTSEWINEPPEPSRPRRLAATSLSMSIPAPSWLPSDRMVTALLVLVLVLSTALLAGGSGEEPLRIAATAGDLTESGPPDGVGGGTAPSSKGDDSAQTAGIAGAATETPATDEDPVEDGQAATSTEESVEELEQASAEDSSVAVAPTEVIAQPTRPASPPEDGAILPYYRVVSYYGHPHDSNMGILGEYGVNDDIEGLHAALAEQAAEYEQADPSRPVKLAFELIGTVAQGDPMSDGSWLLSTDAPTIQRYIDYAAEHDMLVIIDVQIGRRGVPGELDLVRRWLEYPHVHLALDPEFSMQEGEVPGQHIGQIDASDVRYAQEFLVELCEELGLPPKILIVHQFHFTMIQNKDQVAPYPGVQLVIDMDGWGPPELKYETYEVMNTQHPIEFNGVKLFYRQDDPLLSAEEVLALNPIPDLIIYQ